MHTKEQTSYANFSIWLPGVPPKESLTFGSKATIVLRFIKENYLPTLRNISYSNLNSGRKSHREVSLWLNAFLKQWVFNKFKKYTNS